jgi:leader peptidase (prepilin peptidase)/N-methyltransferase
MVLIIFYNESLIQIIIDYVFFSFLLIIFFIDLDHKIIPNRLTYTLAIIGIVLNFYNLNFFDALYFTLLGSLIGGGPILLLMYIFKKVRGVEGMGMGDIKLFIVLGIWFGWLNCLLIIFISAMLGSIIGIAGIMFKRVQPQQQLPFGPFIVISTLIIYLNEEKIINLLF